MFADKRPELPAALRDRTGREPSEEGNPSRGGNVSPWLLSGSRIGPPVGEGGLGNLAARPVLPWRSSGPIPRATLDTDANTERSHQIESEFFLRGRH
jgi:hypothetical protein